MLEAGKTYRYKFIYDKELVSTIKLAYGNKLIIHYIEQESEVFVKVDKINCIGHLEFNFIYPDTGELLDIADGRLTVQPFDKTTGDLLWTDGVFAKFIGLAEEFNTSTVEGENKCPLCGYKGSTGFSSFYCCNCTCDNYCP